MSKTIVAYTDPVSVAAGEQLRCFVSADPGPDTYDLEVVRARAATEPGEGRVESTPVGHPADGAYPARFQPTVPGTFGVYEGGLGAGVAAFEVTVMPTLLGGTSQVLLAASRDGLDVVTLLLDASGRPAVQVAGSAPTVVTLAEPVAQDAWQVVTGGYDPASGEAFVSVRPAETTAMPRGDTTAEARAACAAPAAADTISVGARLVPGVGPRPWDPADPFTGRIERPSATGLEGEPVVMWDLADGINGFTLTDVSGHGRHGTLHNLPMRAVCGSRWDGETTDWTRDPEQFAAAHFYAEGVEDANWHADVTLDLPSDLPSGFYALALSRGDERELVPFFVRPPRGTRTAPVALLVPTATYMAYSNSRFWFEGAVHELLNGRVVEVGPEEQLLVGRPELGLSSYDQYLDGTDVTYVSRRHPNLNMRAGHVRDENYPTDLDLVAWLDHVGQPFDVLCDEDLDADPTLLDGYEVVLTGSHPEYRSRRMWDALQTYTRAGGRLLVLGGNAYIWTVAFHPERPWVMEVRKPPASPKETPWAAAETTLGFTGCPGGEAGEDARTPETLIGVGTASMGFDAYVPYEILPASRDPRVAFAFDGIDGDVLGAHGRLGGAVVGQEWDQADAAMGTPEHALVVARSRGHSMVSRRFGAVKARNHAEMVFFETDGGGAVFTVATMAWCGSLADDAYDNDVARLTGNVLGRFLDPTPFVRP